MKINWGKVLTPIYGVMVVVMVTIGVYETLLGRSLDRDYWLNLLVIIALLPTLLLLRKK